MKRFIFSNVLLILLPAFLWAQGAVANLSVLKDYDSERASSFDHTSGNHDYVSVDPGQTVTIFDADGPGEIRHIWTTLPGWSEAYAHQKVVIRAYWDGEKDPRIETPIGNFFGFTFANPPVFHSALITVNPVQALNSYIPMPFRSHARITITNEGSKQITDYYWDIDWVKLPSLSPDAAYFHAQYRQCAPCQGWYKGNFYGTDFSEAHKDPRWQNPQGRNDYVILDAQGDGQLVDVMMSILNNQCGGWNEGDDIIFIDGEKTPRINGTGGEDYFNGAWGFNPLYATPYVGLVEFSGYEPRSHCTTYRWHVETPIRCHKSIKVTIEDGHANLRCDNIYSVAYWYQKEPHVLFPPLPPVENPTKK